MLPVPPARTHVMLAFKAPWVEATERPGDVACQQYPEESIAQWHERHELLREP